MLVGHWRGLVLRGLPTARFVRLGTGAAFSLARFWALAGVAFGAFGFFFCTPPTAAGAGAAVGVVAAGVLRGLPGERAGFFADLLAAEGLGEGLGDAAAAAPAAALGDAAAAAATAFLGVAFFAAAGFLTTAGFFAAAAAAVFLAAAGLRPGVALGLLAALAGDAAAATAAAAEGGLSDASAGRDLTLAAAFFLATPPDLGPVERLMDERGDLRPVAGVLVASCATGSAKCTLPPVPPGEAPAPPPCCAVELNELTTAPIVAGWVGLAADSS